MVKGKKTSCLVRGLWGCGIVILLFVLTGMGLALMFVFTKPKPAEYGVQQFDHTFSTSAEQTSLDLPPDTAGKKPVKVLLESSMANVQILAGDEPGKIQVDSEYDQANYVLTTDITEADNHVTYHIRFRSKRPFLTMLFSGKIEDTRNRLTVYLPRDLYLGLEMRSKMGEAEVDLTGVQVQFASLDQSMGVMRLAAMKPNPIPMEYLNLSLSAGEMRVEDLQNFRFASLTFDGSMGEVQFSSTGDLIDSASAIVDMSMGEVRMYVPPNAQLKTDVSVSAGNYEGPRGSSSSEVGPDAPTFSIKGSISMGELVVGQKTLRKSIDDLLMKIILTDGVDTALTTYRKLKEEDPGAYDFRENVLNRLGYRLLRRDLNREAIEIFKLNVEVYPDYANGYDSLGEGYMVDGQDELAIQNYKKSLELDPGNENAAKMLARLAQR